MRVVREYVDENNNCEDIAMNLLIAKHAKSAPIHVQEKRKIDFVTQRTFSSSTAHI